MPPELTQWIPPAVIIALMLYLHRSTHHRLDRVESKIGELRERMAHLEGLLEGLREATTCRSVA